jgi:hypothetical protein
VHKVLLEIPPRQRGVTAAERDSAQNVDVEVRIDPEGSVTSGYGIDNRKAVLRKASCEIEVALETGPSRPCLEAYGFVAPVSGRTINLKRFAAIAPLPEA